MLKLATVKSGDVVYDLGCGDGRIVVAAARRARGVRAVGVDIDPRRIAEATDNARKAGVADRTRFIQQDLFEADLRDATVVTLYLLPSLNVRLRPKLLAELPPGARIVSQIPPGSAARVRGWTPLQQREMLGLLGQGEGDVAWMSATNGSILMAPIVRSTP
jgi:SAM-dependent methyltransferase